jgi:methyl acetate hydrolase
MPGYNVGDVLGPDRLNMRRINRREFGGLAAVLGAQARQLSGATSGAAKLDETLRAGIARRNIPAAVAMVASERSILYSGAFGTRDSSGAPAATDSIFAIASMTKAVTTVAALQLVEQGKVRLDEPVSQYLPQLGNLQVLEGFDAQTGKPNLRPAKIPVTLKHLLTHTSGICYDTWDPDMFRYARQTRGTAARVPTLMFEPGTRWQYGMGVDWAGRLVEKVSGMNLEEYFQAKILQPLAMHDTSYLLPASKFDRLVSDYERQADGSLKQSPRVQPAPPKEFNGGGGLYSTTGDYVRFMQMILAKGRAKNGVRILERKTVESMEINQIGAATAGKMKSFRASSSSDVDMQPGASEKWGLGFLINTTPYDGGRSAGSLAWAGIFNTFFWIDPKRSICAVLLMQFLPFVDKEAVGLLSDFEHAVYGNLRANA